MSAWGEAWGASWGVSWGSIDTEERPAGAAGDSQYLKQIREDEEVMIIINAFLFMRQADD